MPNLLTTIPQGKTPVTCGLRLTEFHTLFPSNWTKTDDSYEGLSEEFFLDTIPVEPAAGAE